MEIVDGQNVDAHGPRRHRAHRHRNHGAHHR
jgi:hypothetical protein